MPSKKTPTPPPVYRPQPTPKVLQRKQAVAPPAARVASTPQARTNPLTPTRPTPVAAAQQRRPAAVQPKAATPAVNRGAHAVAVVKAPHAPAANAAARPVLQARNVPSAARSNRGATVQRLATYHDWMADKKELIKKMEQNHYLLQGLTGNVVGQVTNAHATVRDIKALDMADDNVVHPELRDRLTELISGVHIRPATPTHDNVEGNLVAGRTYYELGMEGGGGARIIYDTSNSDIYFSYHYGGRQNGAHTDSPFIKLANLTDAQKAITKYRVLFFQYEVEAYKRGLKAKGTDYASELKLPGLETHLDGLANTAVTYFTTGGRNVPVINDIIAEMWRIYNRAKPNPKAACVYLSRCIVWLNGLNANHTL